MSAIYTSDEYTKKIESERKQEQLENLTMLAAGAGISYAGIKLGNESDTARDYISSLPGANRYSKKYKQGKIITSQQKLEPVDLSPQYKNQTIGRSLNSIIASAEELSPLNILRTLQLSNFIEPFTGVGGNTKTDITHITGDAVEAYSELYNAQIMQQSQGRKRLVGSDLKHGFLMQDGVLYRLMPDGSIDYLDPVLKNAKLVASYTKMGDHISPNRLLEKFANVHGVNLDRATFKQSQIVAIGGDSKVGLTRDWARSYFRYAMEIGYKSLDNPLGGVEELLSAAGASQTNLFSNPTYQKVKNKLNINLGTKGDYTLSTRDSLKVVAKNMAKVSLAGYVGLGVTDSILGAITPESSMWHNGLISGLTGTYAKTRVAAAKVLADPFQSYKEAQEEAAQDSTKLSTLIGFPLAGALLGASTEYYKRMYRSASKSIESATAQSLIETDYGALDKTIKKLGFNNTTPMKSKAIIGGLIGAAVTLPFLPGALIGKSSEQLEDEYSGRVEVENRTNAGWLMGGGKFSGENVKNYQASWVARTLADVKNTVRYGSSEEKRSMDPILHPFRYLSNPYRFEEMHTDDMPYPVWGMDVSYGSFFGKAFQGTVGEIIKPTVVNAEFLKQVRDQRKLEEELEGGVNSTTDIEGGYSIPLQVRPKERSLINEGLMYAPSSPVSDPTRITVANLSATIGDFTGAKGFASGLVLDAVGFGGNNGEPQLARSGSSVSASGDLKDENLGDLMGMGEFVRRLVPHTSSTALNYINPMINTIAPNWLPHDSSRYYNNFQQGNYWDKVDNGEARLAGIGFNKLNPELKDTNPDDYPLVYRYKILSDVAFASPEHLAMKDQLLSMVRDNKLNEQEKEIFYTALEKEQVKSQKREFREYKTDEEFSKLSLPQKALSMLWEPLAHNSESVFEPLTPFRPGSKFIHARSAIEDYEKTQLQGPDTAIWTNPYSHFIKPAINRFVGLIPGTQVPQEAQERDAIDEYFDKIAYLKARREGNTNAALKTTIGATFGGITNVDEMNKFKAGLSADQRLYVDAFSKETDPSKRKKILDMVPEDVGMAYQSIWRNLEIAEEAKKSGKDPEEAIERYYRNNTDKFVKAAGGTSSKYSMSVEGEDAQLKEKRLQAADKVAMDYVSASTGVPSEDWIGWDPRLTAKDVKIRTLTLGKADIFRHGFWDSDVERNDRIKALDSDTQVSTEYNRIRKNLTEERKIKNKIENTLFEQGFVSRRIELTSASRNDVVIRDDQR